MIPRRFRNWILVWTPVTWLVLELTTFPKNRPVHTGFAHVMGGFIDSQVARYPALMLAALGACVLLVGIVGLARRSKARKANILLLVMAIAFGIWAYLAGSSSSGFSWLGHATRYAWLFQTIVIIIAAAATWQWAVANPERAKLTTWNMHQVWKLYRANWQGMVGLYVLLVFTIIALGAPFLIDHYWLDPNSQVAAQWMPPNHHYVMWFGTDQTGQSVLAEFIWSARISLAVGLLATAIATVFGAVIGIAAGFYGRWQGEVLMRITDVFLVVPWLPLAMVLVDMFHTRSYWMIILIIGITSWPGTARVVRSDALRVRELQFVERARAIGSTNAHIMSKHVLPNVFPLIFANTILVVAIAILSETTLSFLGLGDPLNFSWGTMLHYAWAYGAQGIPAWWYLFPPGMAIVLVVVAFTFMGTAFDEVLDPKLRKREESGGEGVRLNKSVPGGWFAGGGVGGSSLTYPPDDARLTGPDVQVRETRSGPGSAKGGPA